MANIDYHGETNIISEFISDHIELHELQNLFELSSNVVAQDVFATDGHSSTQLLGADLNSLLRGIFFIYGRGYSHIYDDVDIWECLSVRLLPGGLQCWEESLEAVLLRYILF